MSHVHPMPLRRPVIQIGAELYDDTTASIEALATDDNVFQRKGSLVDVVRVTELDADALSAAGAPRVRPLTAPTLRERLTRVAQYEVWSAKAKRYVPGLPSLPIVAAVLGRAEYDGIRPITGILEAPSIRPDGSLIQTPGYDSATGYLYEPAIEFPPMTAKPSQKDAARVLAELHEVFRDFPFAKPEHEAAAIAGLLTIVGRPAVRGAVPGFVNDASTRGTGKTLVTDVQATVATGRATAKMSWPPDDIELEKVLAAYALRSATIVNFDNVTRSFGGAPLDRCLTAIDDVELRVLGKSEVPVLLWRAVIFATGNNVMLSGDTARRVLISRLESPLERPEERSDFLHPNLLEWTREQRARLVVAALTVLRAWFVAGRPDVGCKTWGSFEAWSSVIPPAMVFAGSVDPMLARPSVQGQEEPEKAALDVLLTSWSRFDPAGRGVTAKGLVGLLYPGGQAPKAGQVPDGCDDVREAIESLAHTPDGKVPGTNAVGKALTRYRARVVGGRKLMSTTASGGAQRWSVHGDVVTCGDVVSAHTRACAPASELYTAKTTSPHVTTSPEGDWEEGRE